MVQTEAYYTCTHTVGTEGLTDLGFNGCEITLHLLAGGSVGEVRGQFVGVSSVPSHGFWGSSSAPQACWQVPHHSLLSHLAGLTHTFSDTLTEGWS